MKKNFQRVAFWGGIVMSASLALSSCDKDYESSNGVGSEATEGEDYLVPFFEVAKGDSISKDVYRAKPYSEDEAPNVVVSSEDDNSSEALRGLYTPISTKYRIISGIQARSFKRASEAPSYYMSMPAVTSPCTPLYFYKLNYDLNAGAGGKFIYFYYCPEDLESRNALILRMNTNTVLRDVIAYSGRTGGDHLNDCKNNMRKHYGYDWEWHYEGTDGAGPVAKEVMGSIYPNAYYGTGKQVDLNEGAGGKYIYLFGSNNCKNHNPIQSIAVGKSMKTSGYFCATSDLNDGAGGEYIYLFTKFYKD